VTSLSPILYLSPPIPNAAEIMSQFDLVVVPSRVEGLGLVACEALAAQTPVLATNIPGLRQALPPDWPLLVPPNNPEALMNVIMAAVRGEIDLVKLGKIGYSHVHGHSVEKMSHEYLNSYTEYMAEYADQGPSPKRPLRTSG
jgi:glycosyltransferase involved in cell wall biosynthesis